MKCKFLIYVCCLVSFAFLFTNCSNSEPVKVHVLFIGNSLTYANDLPKTIVQMARSRHISMGYEMYAPGGYRLSQHASDPLLIKKINQGNWDFIVLQEQSQMPAFPQEQVEREVYPYAKRLSQLIRKANPKAVIVFYMTMAKKNGDVQNAKFFPELGTYAGMQEKINAAYMHMAQQNRGLLAPVGMAWQSVRMGRPIIDLYSDDTHPNSTGSYLAACVFYALLFNDSPMGLPHPREINEETTLYLQEMAQQTIKSQSWDWQEK